MGDGIYWFTNEPKEEEQFSSNTTPGESAEKRGNSGQKSSEQNAASKYGVGSPGYNSGLTP
jgi:hypothetical protein